MEFEEGSYININNKVNNESNNKVWKITIITRVILSGRERYQVYINNKTTKRLFIDELYKLFLDNNIESPEYIKKKYIPARSREYIHYIHKFNKLNKRDESIWKISVSSSTVETDPLTYIIYPVSQVDKQIYEVYLNDNYHSPLYIVLSELNKLFVDNDFIDDKYEIKPN